MPASYLFGKAVLHYRCSAATLNAMQPRAYTSESRRAFGAFLRERRRSRVADRRRMSQRVAALEVGVVRETYAKWECGKYAPEEENLRKLSRALGFGVAEARAILEGASGVAVASPR